MGKVKSLSRVKISKKFFKHISKLVLDTIKIDEYTKTIIRQEVIENGYYSYIGLIKKHIDFLTPIRLMVLVDYVNILDALKYYFRDFKASKYQRNISYDLIIGLHSAEFKMILLENIYELFGNAHDIDILLHDKNVNHDIVVTIKELTNIKISDSEGYLYETSLKPGKYAFESRACSSITNTKYILADKRRTGPSNDFERYFIVVPRDADVYENVIKELEKNNIKVTYSNISTIDIVNDVVYMEGILKDSD